MSDTIDPIYQKLPKLTIDKAIEIWDDYRKQRDEMIDAHEPLTPLPNIRLNPDIPKARIAAEFPDLTTQEVGELSGFGQYVTR